MALPNDKKKKVKEKDPSKYIELEPILDEAQKGTAVFAWGRMNPMTAGHEKLVQKVASVAKSEKAIPHVFLTHSFDKKKNPLAYDDKIKYAQKAFGDIVKKSNSKTIFQLMKQLNTRFNRVILVAGSDRVKEFNDTLNKYNGKEYKFDEIKVVSAGARDPDADDVSGISGTKMRGFAVDDMDKFKKNLPKRIQPDAEDIAALVRKGMNMSESEEIHIDDMEELSEVLDRQQRRKKSLQMRKFRHKMARGREKAKKRTATLEVLKKRARKDAINMLKKKFSKNRRYADLSFAEKEVIDKRIAKISKQRIETLAKKLLPKTKQKERDRKLNMMKGGATKNESLDARFESFLEEKTGAYYKGVDKDKRDARAAHFEKGKKMDDDNPAAYKPAPGDKEAKTKESKHTKKFRDMYGESAMWGQRQGKRPHMLLDKNGKTKFDARFKMYKPKNTVQEDYEDLKEELMDLIESTEAFIELEENSKEGLKKKAEKSGMPYGILKKVYDRGVAAWRTGHRPGTTPEQWGYARVNSFVTKSSGTWGKADKDLAAKVRKEEVEIDELSMSVKDATKSGLSKAFDKQKKDIKKDLKDLRSRLNKKEDTDLDSKFEEFLGESRYSTNPQADREKRAFKRKEHEAEWKRDQEIERRNKQRDSAPETHHVYINKKVWKKNGKPVEFSSKNHAKAAGNSILKKDPKKEIHITHHSYTTKHGGAIKEEVELAEARKGWKKINSYLLGKPAEVHTNDSGYTFGKVNHGKHAGKFVMVNFDDEIMHVDKSAAAMKRHYENNFTESVELDEASYTGTAPKPIRWIVSPVSSRVPNPKKYTNTEVKAKTKLEAMKLGAKEMGMKVLDVKAVPKYSDEAKLVEAGAGEEGTNKLVNRYKKDTPNA